MAEAEEGFGRPHAVLTFRDRAGQLWGAGAILGPLVRVGADGEVVEQCEILDFQARGMDLRKFVVIEREVRIGEDPNQQDG